MNELEELHEKIKDLLDILGNADRVNEIIKTETREIAAKFGDEEELKFQPQWVMLKMKTLFLLKTAFSPLPKRDI